MRWLCTDCGERFVPEDEDSHCTKCRGIRAIPFPSEDDLKLMGEDAEKVNPCPIGYSAY
jgi:hypothetical protein